MCVCVFLTLKFEVELILTLEMLMLDFVLLIDVVLTSVVLLKLVLNLCFHVESGVLC